MQIHSNFKDCYDRILSFSSEDTNDVVYNRIMRTTGFRNSGELPESYSFILQSLLSKRQYSLSRFVEKKHKQKVWSMFSSSTCIHADCFSLVFCGKIYRGLQVTCGSLCNARKSLAKDLTSEWALHTECEHFAYSVEDLVKIFEDHGIPVWDPEKEKYVINPYEFKGFTDIFEVNNSDSIASAIMNSRLICAKFSQNGSGQVYELIENPRLDDIQFQRVLPPFNIAQELSMYIGGILAPENKPMVQISDKDRLVQHGFDKKSFRKPPTKKKGR